MKIHFSLLFTLVAPVRAFITPQDGIALSRTSFALDAAANHAPVVDDDDDETSSTPPSSRRSFLNHVVTATTAGTLSTLSMEGLNSPAVAATGNTLAGQIQLPPMGLGAWSWGDSLFWGYDKKNDNDLKEVFDYAINNAKSSTTLLDTAEVYGFGRSEELIGKFSRDSDPSKVQVATKFAALPFRTRASDVVKACEKSAQRLGRPIDLYQIHFPNAWSNAEYWDGLAMAFDRGLVKAVGVSNYGVDATRACHDALAQRGIQLASNQIQMNLLYRWPEQNGLLQACDDLGVQVLAYSPLALGMLTGKYTRDKPPRGPRKAIYEQLLTTPDYENLLATMKDVAAGHDDDGEATTLSQVALNWARAKKTIPIPGARTLSQIQKNNAALDWTMTPEEVALLDREAAKVNTFVKPGASPFPKKDINTGLVMFDS